MGEEQIEDNAHISSTGNLMDCGAIQQIAIQKDEQVWKTNIQFSFEYIEFKVPQGIQVGHLSGAVKGAVIDIGLECIGEEMKGTPYVKTYGK